MKAFLSYSSNDRQLVDRVANQLGRQFCLYDQFVFETGEDFSTAIKRCLDEAAVFVLFASKHSLASLWVKLEVDEAYLRKLRETITQAMVYIIDDELKLDALPEWVRRSLVRSTRSSNTIARDIRAHLDQLLRERRQVYFIGRGIDINRFEEMLTPTDGSTPPRVFVVSGLPGIGRRTLLKHGASNLLGLKKSIELRLEEGDSINDICAKLANIAETFSTSEEFNRTFQEIQKLPKEAALERIVQNLRASLAIGELPILIDEGGFLDSEGYMTSSSLEFARAILQDATIYIGFVSFRKPQDRTDPPIPVLKLTPLARQDTERLLQRLANDRELPILPQDLTEIAQYVAGYPPSAYFAIQQAKDYGVDLVVNHKRRLVEFRTVVFLRHIEGLGLQTIEGSILQLLASFSPLPLYAIVKALRVELETIDKLLTRLIDLSLIIADGDSLYRISDPISEAASNTYGLPSRDISQAVANSVSEHLHSDLANRRYLDLSRVLFRAARFSGDDALSDSTVRLASDLIRLTEEYYHRRRYEQSIECGRIAIAERPETINGRSYLIRSLIQRERWTEAETELNHLQKYAPARDVHFLRGFLERRRGNFRMAIAEFEEALRQGRRGAAVSRELSQVYYLVGDLELSRQRLQTALENHGDNRYVVDLWAQLSAELRNEAEARQALARLEVIDRPMFYHYRRSRIEWCFRNLEAAREAAHIALGQEESPPFSVMAQVVLCEIASANLDEASRFLKRLDNDYGDVRRDVRTGLHCRLELARGRSAEALRLCDRFTNTESRYYKVIRYDALRAELTGSKLDSGIREMYQHECDELRKTLGDDISFDISDLDSD